MDVKNQPERAVMMQRGIRNLRNIWLYARAIDKDNVLIPDYKCENKKSKKSKAKHWKPLGWSKEDFRNAQRETMDLFNRGDTCTCVKKGFRHSSERHFKSTSPCFIRGYFRKLVGDSQYFHFWLSPHLETTMDTIEEITPPGEGWDQQSTERTVLHLKTRIEHGMSRVDIVKKPGTMGENLLKDARYADHLQWVCWLGKNLLSSKTESFSQFVRKQKEF